MRNFRGLVLLVGLVNPVLAGEPKAELLWPRGPKPPAIAGQRFEGEPKAELLWPGGAPGAKGDRPSDRPTLTFFHPDPKTAVGTAVVICPGGGYSGLAADYEGSEIARWFNSIGVSGFVLQYRHRGGGYGHPAPLQDAQRAIRTIRARAGQWHVAADRIGIMGFSAGGHLASTAGTHFDRGDPKSPDPIERVSCRPDFLVLCYAVIALGEPYTNRGSQENLLGKDADPGLGQEPFEREAGDGRRPRRRFCFTPIGTRPCHRRMPCSFISRFAGPACQPSCTSTPPAPTAWAWREKRPALRPGRSG